MAQHEKCFAGSVLQGSCILDWIAAGQLCVLRGNITPDFPQSEIAATNFYDSDGSLGEELGEELGEIFCTFSCFIRCTEWPTNLLPKFLPIYHSMSCGWKYEISSPRASGVWGPQETISTSPILCSALGQPHCCQSSASAAPAASHVKRLPHCTGLLSNFGNCASNLVCYRSKKPPLATLTPLFWNCKKNT